MNTNDNPDQTFEEDVDEETLLGDESAATEGGDDTEDLESDDPSSDSAADDEDFEEGSDDDEEEEKEDPMAKFKGKTPEQLVEMYRNLEKRVTAEALRKAQEMVEGKLNINTAKKKAGDDDALMAEIEKLDFSNMDPKEFARWNLAQIDARSTQKAIEIYEQGNKTKAIVQRDIRESTKAHPHLKENEGYRDIVINLIEAADARGETLSLKKACEKADKALGITAKAAVPQAPKKKVKTGVEKPSGTDARPNETEEDRIKQGMMSTKSPLSIGGLGL
jgi:hypothetical protein